MKRYVTWFAAVVLVGACGSSSSKDEDYSYSYKENGCATGRHTFSSKKEYCSALQDDSLNHGCAGSIRAQTYESDCGSN